MQRGAASAQLTSRSVAPPADRRSAARAATRASVEACRGVIGRFSLPLCDGTYRLHRGAAGAPSRSLRRWLSSGSGATLKARLPNSRWRGLGRLEPDRLAWIALAGLLLVGAAILYYETRGTTFSTDEW